jgi:hypothetical protein
MFEPGITNTLALPIDKMLGDFWKFYLLVELILLMFWEILPNFFITKFKRKKRKLGIMTLFDFLKSSKIHM